MGMMHGRKFFIVPMGGRYHDFRNPDRFELKKFTSR